MYHKKKIKEMVLENFIVLEGLDGAGTTTQADLLSSRCRDEGIPAFLTREPTDHDIGLIIRTILQKKAAVRPHTMAYLFAADRNEHLDGPGGIREAAAKGLRVICDRYIFSSLAYQSVDCGWDMVYALNSGFPLPEFLVFLDITPGEGEKRLAGRREREIYEYTDFQTQVSVLYEKTLEAYAESGIKILRLNATEPPELIHEKIWAFVQ